MGANAATVPNNTARAVSSPPMGAYILIDMGRSGGFSSKCLWTEATVGVRVDAAQSPRAMTHSTAMCWWMS